MDLGRSSVKLFLMQGGRSILLFLAVVYFARRLGASELGSLFLFQALLGLLTIPADLGVRGALEKRMSEGRDRDRLLGSALALKLGLLGTVSVAVFLARSYVNQYIGVDLVLILILTLVTFELSDFFVQALRGELRVGETAILKFAVRFLWVGIGVVLVAFGHGVTGIAVGYAVSGTITAVWGYWRCDTPVGYPTLEHARSLIAYAKFHAISSTGGRIYQWMDIAIIGFFLSQEHVSAYEVSWQVTLLVLLVSKSIGWSLFPQVSQWDADGDHDKIEWTVSKAISFALFFSLPALIGGTLFASEILRYLFGPEYVFGAVVLAILLVEKVFQSFDDIIESALRGLDRPDLAAVATVVTVGINLVLNPLLVVTMGFVGAAIATAVVGVVSVTLHTHYLSRFVSIEFPFRIVGWYVVSASVMGAVLVVVRSAVSITDAPTLFAVIGFGAAIYGVLAVSIPTVRRDVIVPAIRVFV